MSSSVGRRLLATGVGHLAERRAATRSVAVALSGGVDSAIAASLLAADPTVSDIICLYARVWDGDDEAGAADDAAASGAVGGCAAADDAVAAARTARALGLPLTNVDAVAPYWTDVFEPFVAAYAAGATPNPDLGCNVAVKFGRLLAAARAAGADTLATGHYARLAPSSTGLPRLLRGLDTAKDQSYFLAGVPGAALAAAEFPVGGLTKHDVKTAAATHPGLCFLLHRRSSAGICFVGRRRFGAFMAGYAAPVPGRWVEVADTPAGADAPSTPLTPSLWAGPDAGPCPDILAVTMGQRARLGGGTAARYVAGKDLISKLVVTAPGRAHAALFSRSASLAVPCWVAGEAPPEVAAGGALQFKARYRAPLRWGRVVSAGQNAGFTPTSLVRLAAPPPSPSLVIHFDAPVRAVTPGQAVALYRGEECLGAAPIAEAGVTLHERGERVPTSVAEGVDADAEAGWA